MILNVYSNSCHFMMHEGNRIAPLTHINKFCNIVFANQFQISVITLCKLERDKKEYEECLNVATLSEDLSIKIFFWWNCGQTERIIFSIAIKKKFASCSSFLLRC